MKRQQMQVTLSHPPYNYRRHMFFNRYCMEPCDSFTIFHFGLVDTAGHILDSYACLMHETSIAANMKTLEDFYVAQRKTKLKGKYTHEWMPPTRPEKVDFSMIMAMAVFSDNTIGEIVFASHAMQPALTSVRQKFADARKRSPKANSPALQHVIEGDALAALKCDWFVLKAFLEQLMESTNASKS